MSISFSGLVQRSGAAKDLKGELEQHAIDVGGIVGVVDP